jgi:hypothetical protein
MLLAMAGSFLIMGYVLAPLLQVVFPVNAHINGASVVGAAATFGERLQALGGSIRTYPPTAVSQPT